MVPVRFFLIGDLAGFFLSLILTELKFLADSRKFRRLKSDLILFKNKSARSAKICEKLFADFNFLVKFD